MSAFALMSILAALFLGVAAGTDENSTADFQLYNWQIAPAIMSVIENQFNPETIMSWDRDDWNEIIQDAYSQLEATGVIRSATLDDIKEDMRPLIYNYQRLHKSAKVGLVNVGFPVPQYMAWDELVREYYLGNGKKPVQIGTFGDGFTEAVWNGLPHTAHKMTVLREQSAAMAND